MRTSSSNSSAPARTMTTRGLEVELGGETILRDVGFELPPGAITALVGANGSGKTTLLKTLARIAKPTAGSVLLDGAEINSLPTREVARRLALLPQGVEAPAGVTVGSLVELGRLPHIGRLGSLRRDDREAIEWALEVTDLLAFRDRAVDSLSGGERQRAWLALSLAQRTSLLLLDEPTTYLDVRHQLEVLMLVQRLNREHGLTVCWVLHDLNAAVAFSDRMACLRDGEIVAHGDPATLLTAPLVAEVFGIDASVLEDPATGRPICVPRGPSQAAEAAPEAESEGQPHRRAGVSPAP
jgi:ABC-type cobalamin/Fe3+-siderophores transport system ATPase subunit